MVVALDNGERSSFGGASVCGTEGSQFDPGRSPVIREVYLCMGVPTARAILMLLVALQNRVWTSCCFLIESQLRASEWFMVRGFACCLVLLASLLCGEALAAVKIEAVVDDKVLTSLDIDKRIKANDFFYRTGHAGGNRDEVLQTLIDEAVLLFEAKELKIPVDEEELNAESARLFSVLGVCDKQTIESCAAGNGLDKDDIMSHIKARIIWSKILSARVAPFLAISDDEVRNYIAETRSNGQETVLDLEQVFVPFRSGEVLDSVLSELHKDVVLDKIEARYREHGVYAERTTGAVIGSFMPDIKAVLLKAKIGDILGPMRIDRGYLLIKLLGKVRVSKSFMNSIVSVKQLSAAEGDGESIVHILKGKDSVCEVFSEAVKDIGVPTSLEVRAGDLSSKLQYMLESSREGEVLSSARDDGKVDIVVLCGITRGDVPGEEDLSKIRQVAYTEKLVVASGRQMEAIRRRHFTKKF